MAKKRRPLSEKKSSLAIALEAGRNVKGMTGFISLNDQGYDRDESELFVKVRCLGIDTEGGCGLKVKVQIAAGAGELSITPCRWLDTVADVSSHYKLRQRQNAAKQAFDEINSRPHYHRDKATFLQNYIEQNMTAKQQCDWKNHVESIAKGYKKPPKSLDTFGKSDLAGLAKVAVCVVNELDATQVPERFDW